MKDVVLGIASVSFAEGHKERLQGSETSAVGSLQVSNHLPLIAIVET